MFGTEVATKEIALNYKPSLGKPSAFLKAGARITIISVLSRQVKNQTAFLRNIDNSTNRTEIRKPESNFQEIRNSLNEQFAASAVVPVTCEGKENSMTMNVETSDLIDCPVKASVKGGSCENRVPLEIVEDNGGEGEGPIGMMNGISKEASDGNDEDGENNNGVFLSSSSTSKNGPVVFKNRINSNRSHRRISKNEDGKTPFDFMKERKLSEPVMSPRKRSNVMTPKMSRCQSTVDLRETEKPIVRELGGYKFFQKPCNKQDHPPAKKTNSYRLRENQSSEIASMKKTIAEQKVNIANREKHVLQMEKKISLLENESSKYKKQISSLREKLKDCSGTVDFLRREKELLVSERDRLNFTLLTYEDELKELRSQNVNLVTEYENAEQSRKIAVGHLHELERTCQQTHQEVPVESTKHPNKLSPEETKNVAVNNSPKFTAQLNSIRECVKQLRKDRETLQDKHTRLNLFFVENLQSLADGVRERVKRRAKDETESHFQEKLDEVRVVPGAESISEPAEEIPENNNETDLERFKKKLKANEELIDQLANEIRDLENKKKGLLESRFTMIQEFQAGREIETEELEEEVSEREENVDKTTGSENKKSTRVTRKIRKLERTLSMDHGVGKLDCIQKLCKKLEDCEQRMHELETENKELRQEHDDLEEEAKYLKYVLSYRGDTMKAQLEAEFESKMTALKEELRIAKERNPGKSQNTLQELTDRNHALEAEVQRLHEELKSLLQNLPALQIGGEKRSRRSSEGESDTSQNLGNTDETVRSLEEKVAHLQEEKRVLLLSMQTISGQRESRRNASSAENDSSFSKNLLVLEKNLREVENENAYLAETLQRIREVLETDDEDIISDEQRNSCKISKLRNEIEKLDEKAEAGRRNVLEESFRDEVFDTCARHEERISELEKEVVRLHNENKSLLSSIIRLQTDPNFTFSEDATDNDLNRSFLESPVGAVAQANVVDDARGMDVVEGAVSSSTKVEILGSSSKPARSVRDKEVQASINSDAVCGILGYLERDLDRLKEALGQQSILAYKPNEEQKPDKDLPSQSRRGSSGDIEQLKSKLNEVGEHNNVLQEKLEESEAIRSDLHRTISIATDMATEERQKCADLMRTKTRMEKDMLKLANENRELRDALDTLSRVRKRRNSRAQSMNRASHTSESHEEDGSVTYLPRVKAHNYSESEISDIDSPFLEKKCYSRIE